jgi:hypothetical protein
MSLLEVTNHPQVSAYSLVPNVQAEPVRLPNSPPQAAKVATFISAIRQHAQGTNFKSLEQLIHHVSVRGQDGIQHALLKPSGIFRRLFNFESEWWESRTHLGRVIYRLMDFATCDEPVVTFMERIERGDLEVANREAAALLRQLNTPSQVDLSDFNGIVFKKAGSKNHFFGFSVGPIGDLAGSGKTGLYIVSLNKVYVVFAGDNFPSPFDVTSLDGTTNGFTITLPTVSGATVTALGDVTGDGNEDFLVCMSSASPNQKLYAGQCRLVFGRKGSWPAEAALEDLPGTSFEGEFPYDSLGFAAAGRCDFNGDGTLDFVVTAPGGIYHLHPGRAYVFYGGPHLASGPIDPSKHKGYTIVSSYVSDYFGSSVDCGSVSGRGGPDLIIGAERDSENGLGAGKVYVRYYTTSPQNPIVNASTIGGIAGAVFLGESRGDGAGQTVRFLGNVTGDRLGSFAVGASGASVGDQESAGKTYIIRGLNGTQTSPTTFAGLDGKNGTTVTGIEAFNECGMRLSPVKFNGDAFMDVAIGCPLGDVFDKVRAGFTMVVYGHNGAWPSVISPDQLNGPYGFIANGVSSYDGTGSSVSGGIGPFNGKKALAIGAPDTDNSGVVYLLLSPDEEPPRDSGVAIALATVGSLLVAASVGGTVAAFILTRRRHRAPEAIPLVN